MFAPDIDGAETRLAVTLPVEALNEMLPSVLEIAVTPVLVIVRIPVPYVTEMPEPEMIGLRTVSHWVVDTAVPCQVSPTGSDRAAFVDPPSMFPPVAGYTSNGFEPLLITVIFIPETAV